MIACFGKIRPHCSLLARRSLSKLKFHSSNLQKRFTAFTCNFGTRGSNLPIIAKKRQYRVLIPPIPVNCRAIVVPPTYPPRVVETSTHSMFVHCFYVRGIALFGAARAPRSSRQVKNSCNFDADVVALSYQGFWHILRTHMWRIHEQE